MPLIQLDVGRMGVVILQHRLNQQERIAQVAMGDGSPQRSLGITSTQLAILDVRMMDILVVAGWIGIQCRDGEVVDGGAFLVLEVDGKGTERNVVEGNGRRLRMQRAFSLRKGNFGKLITELYHLVVPVALVEFLSCSWLICSTQDREDISQAPEGSEQFSFQPRQTQEPSMLMCQLAASIGLLKALPRASELAPLVLKFIEHIRVLLPDVMKPKGLANANDQASG